MVSIYKITNPDTGVSVSFNEIIFLEIIKYLEKRGTKLQIEIINKWEKLEKKTFNKEEHLI